MDRVSRPLLGLLLATAAVAVLWVTMLGPSSSDSSGGSGNRVTGPSLGQLGRAIAAAHGAVATANAASSRAGGQVAPASSASTASAAGSTAATGAAGRTRSTTPAAHDTHAARGRRGHHAAAVRAPQTPVARLHLVTRALEQHRVLAMLFYNPSGADDRLVDRELAAVPTGRGAVVKLAIPLSELASYSLITQQVPVTGSPTLVIVDRGLGATEIVGFADRFEIAQRIDDALAIR